MLAKLLKYELKASARTLIPLYIGVIILSIICGGLVMAIFNGANFAESNVFAIFFGLLYLLLFALIVAMMVLTIVSIIQRFYKNLLGDEGFLMFTLPVSSLTLLTSKLLAAIFWTICSSLIGMCATFSTMLIPMMSVTPLHWSDFVFIFQEAWSQLFTTAGLPTFVVQVILVMFISMIGTILTAYAAMMIGQLQPFSQHQLIVSFIAFFLINWAFGTVFSLITNTFDEFFFMHVNDFSEAIKYLWLALAGALLQAAVLFFGTNWLMQRKLNL